MMQRLYPFHDLRQIQNTMDRMRRRADSRSNGSEESRIPRLGPCPWTYSGRVTTP